MITCVVPALIRGDDDRALLRVTVQSALDAGFGDVVVVDDGSPVEVTVPRSRVRVVRRDANGGPAAALNTGIENARHDWIARLDVGDAYLPSKLNQLRATIAAGARASFSAWTADDGVVRGPADDWCAALAYDNQFAASSTMSRVDVWREVGGYDEALRYADDWDFAVKVERVCGWTYYPEVTTIAVAWPGGLTDVGKTDARQRTDRARVARASRNLSREVAR